MSLSKVFKDNSTFKPVKLLTSDKIIDINEVILTENSESKAVVPDLDQPVFEEVSVEQEAVSTDDISANEQVSSGDDHPSESAPQIDVEAVRQQAFDEGMRQAMTDAAGNLNAAADSLGSACIELEEARSSLLRKNREVMINLIMKLTGKIIKTELSTSRDSISKTVEKTLDEALSSDESHLLLHPEDIKTIEEVNPALMESIKGMQHIVIAADDTIARGGCLLESKVCKVDATIEGQLEEARFFLEEQLGDPEPLDPSEQEI